MNEKNPFESIGEEEGRPHEDHEDDEAAKFAAWRGTLTFITLEVLGKEVYDYFLGHKPDFGEVGVNEIPIDLQLCDWEKYLFRLVDSVGVYVKKNGCFLPTQKSSEFAIIARSLGNLFWSALKLNHPRELWGKSIGLRKMGDKDYVLVELPEQQNPFGKIFGFPMPGGPE